ncbi:hypothetical protein DNTS_022859 [Danionella cerebrum]|uniref:Protein inturned n=1 Tax=Danionella cerebrum TaxID=2873325 RepID=A0A553QU82_9TELE|nr:hypothetical protein DNTS_022859 [Danionella translucida]
MAFSKTTKETTTDLSNDVAEEEAGETDSDASSFSYSDSDYSDDLEPEWLDDVQKNGDLFYLELSEGEEEALLGQMSANLSSTTNHVRFCEQEAEIINNCGKKPSVSCKKSQAKLKKLSKILGRKPPSKRNAGLPTSILKSQVGQTPGVVVQQRRLKDVCIYLNPKRLDLEVSKDRRGLLEALLGVIHRAAENREKRGEKIFIHGLVPHSPASKCAEILIGDALVAVDDVEVTSENIERVLSCIPGPTQVRLTLETACPMALPPISKAPAVSQLVRLLWAEDSVELQMSIDHIPHVAMFLSLKLDSEALQDEVSEHRKKAAPQELLFYPDPADSFLYLQQEVLYLYPTSDASVQLKAVRGVFLTLCDLLENVTAGQVLSSSLWLKQQLVHVGYWKEGSNLLVIALPASRVPLLTLQTVIKTLVQTLTFMYGSLHRAFCEQENTPRLDHFFCLFFQQIIQPSRLIHSSSEPQISESLFLQGLPAVRWLTLPQEIKVEVDSILSDFESADFGDMSEDFFGMRRLYMILGSCLFYKGFLIANHLPREALLDVSVFCQHYCLLEVLSGQRLSQLVIWRRVFPSHLKHRQQSPHFLLIVGLRSFLQCVLLEAGGYASSPPALSPPAPDCVYVDQVKATLLQLQSLDGSIQEWLSAPPTPCLAQADCFLASGGRARAQSSPIINRLSAAIKPQNVIGRSLFGEAGPAGVRGRSESRNEAPSEVPLDPALIIGARRDSIGSDGSSSGTALNKKLPSPFQLSSLRKSLSEQESEERNGVHRLTSGPENTLFHYVLMESVQGVFIAPDGLSGSIHSQLLQSFHRCCLSIRQSFQEQQGSRGLGSVKEHGILFQCKPQNWSDAKKPAPTMSYWVIGRMLLEPVPQEFYVCFHDSVPELPLEMAFRLSFALAV